MAMKRGRAAYEAELQQAQSPFVFFGKALPPLDPAVKDDGSYVPVWKQEVVDERGRKRLHGAFTGGFSAGYFNTVGSKEGWTPSTFVSSRTNRAKQDAATAQRAEDFMDDEDLAEAEESKVIGQSGVYAGLGQTSNDANRAQSLIDVLRPESDNAGFKLLRKMGWKDGQGLGDRMRRTVHDGDAILPDTGNDEKHFFAPKDPGLISFTKKTDRKGLGLDSTKSLPATTKTELDSDPEDQTPSWAKIKAKPAKKAPKKGVGIGIGILNDGSDDEDPYGMGPKIAYNRTISSNKAKTKKPVQVSANPSLVNKPVFVSKKTSQQNNGTNQKCHDGRPPPEGFILGPASSATRIPAEQMPPTVPEDWISKKVSAGILAPQNRQAYMSTVDAAKASTHGIASRAKLLDEAPLPGKSIFDFLTPAQRDKIATATGKNNLPPGQGELLIDESSTDDSKLPFLDSVTAKAALDRQTTGFVPYRDDPDKFVRYHHFLSWRAGLREDAPSQPKTMSREDFLKECSEFAHAATVFKPVSGLMASRFVSAGGSDSAKEDGIEVGTKSHQNLTPQMQAAFAGQWGPLTTTKHLWYPAPLLCKRFGVEPPKHTIPGNEPEEGLLPVGVTKDLELLGEASMKELRTLAGIPADQSGSDSIAAGKGPAMAEPAPEKPGMEVFKAIFGSDDEDD